ARASGPARTPVDAARERDGREEVGEIGAGWLVIRVPLSAGKISVAGTGVGSVPASFPRRALSVPCTMRTEHIPRPNKKRCLPVAGEYRSARYRCYSPTSTIPAEQGGTAQPGALP